MMIKVLYLLSIFLLTGMPTVAQKIKEKPEWKKYFDELKVTGCFLFYDLSTNQFSGHNLERTSRGFVPASTFKLFSSLAILESGVAKNVDEVFTWDGVDRGDATWNRNQTLRLGFRHSTLWLYQELVRRVGERRMLRYISRAEYGNRMIGGGVDRFWLDGGDMRITPKQQIEFLVRLHRYRLPFSREVIDAVKEIAVVERSERYVLRVKMGSATESKIAWLVGYLVRSDRAYFFAMNVETLQEGAASVRVPITRNLLRSLKLLD